MPTTSAHTNGHSGTDSDSHSDTGSTTRKAFQRGTHAPDALVNVRVPAWMRDKLEEERARIEAAKPRSLDFYAAKVFGWGLERLATIKPIEDTLG